MNSVNGGIGKKQKKSNRYCYNYYGMGYIVLGNFSRDSVSLKNSLANIKNAW